MKKFIVALLVCILIIVYINGLRIIDIHDAVVPKNVFIEEDDDEVLEARSCTTGSEEHS